jgi:hypothetical protein
MLVTDDPSNLSAELELPREIYPEIFLGKVTRWNDPRIAVSLSATHAATLVLPGCCGSFRISYIRSTPAMVFSWQSARSSG